MRFIFFALMSCLVLSCQKTGQAPVDTPVIDNKPLPEGPTRGVWLTNVDSEAMFNRDNLRAAVDLCYKNRINTIFAVVWNKSYTLYPSKVMEQTFGAAQDPAIAGFDPLQELITYAKPKGIKVYAWFEFGFASSYGAPNDGGRLLALKPQWAARDAGGKILSKNNFQWMNALNPEVQDFMISLIKECVTKYDLTGIQGDDRLPAMPSEGGYDEFTKAAYLQETGKTAPSNHKDADWLDWRAKKLNSFAKRLYQELKAVKPQLQVAMSPSIFPWSKEEYLQDWPTWLKEGYVDLVSPQVYRRDLVAYTNEINKLNSQVDAAKKSQVAPGILLKVGTYVASADLLEKMVQANRSAGFSGEVFFFFEGQRQQPAFFEKYKTMK
jgi:uncharacterized lipoprotein YddW (UPF0748 family)